jgi:hypothetical protein
MLIFKIVVTLLLLWLAVGVIGLITTYPKMGRGVFTSAIALCAALVIFFFVAYLNSSHRRA